MPCKDIPSLFHLNEVMIWDDQVNSHLETYYWSFKTNHNINTKKPKKTY